MFLFIPGPVAHRSCWPTGPFAAVLRVSPQGGFFIGLELVFFLIAACRAVRHSELRQSHLKRPGPRRRTGPFLSAASIENVTPASRSAAAFRRLIFENRLQDSSDLGRLLVVIVFLAVAATTIYGAKYGVGSGIITGPDVLKLNVVQGAARNTDHQVRCCRFRPYRLCEA